MFLAWRRSSILRERSVQLPYCIVSDLTDTCFTENQYTIFTSSERYKVIHALVATCSNLGGLRFYVDNLMLQVIPRIRYQICRWSRDCCLRHATTSWCVSLLTVPHTIHITSPWSLIVHHIRFFKGMAESSTFVGTHFILGLCVSHRVKFERPNLKRYLTGGTAWQTLGDIHQFWIPRLKIIDDPSPML